VIDLEIPIVLAPLAGGPSTPELAAAVSDAGGLGFLAAGYLTAQALQERLDATRALTVRPIGVNLFVPNEPTDPTAYEPYVNALAAEGLDVGAPRSDDDEWEAKLALLENQPVNVVSFTFGCPSEATIARIQAAGAEAWVTITHPDEARAAVRAGADAVVAQGAEAGGHRGSWVDQAGLEPIGLISLLQLVQDLEVPRIASGGIASPQAVQAVLALGASAAQVGTAFMRTPEAGTSPVHKERLASDAPTGLTRAFSGRLARGIRNRFMDEHPDAPVAYPEIHHVTAPVRAAARQRGDAELINLWAGQAHALAQERPAAEVARALAGRA
jgi:nitronate monooxygenase